jgi:hypothetical protein
MKITMKGFAPGILVALIFASSLEAGSVTNREETRDGAVRLGLENEWVLLTVTVRDGALVGDRLEGRPDWLAAHGASSVAFQTDGDFGLDLMYTGWRAPDRVHNADNPIVLSNDDFEVVEHRFDQESGGAGGLSLLLRGRRMPLEVRIEYRLGPQDSYVRRRLAVRDPESGRHYLRSIWPVRARLDGASAVIKDGGFGMPVALEGQDGGAFLGLEYPAGTNGAERDPTGALRVEAGVEVGRQIPEDWLDSEPVVWGLSPDRHVKRWFESYLDDIRVAPLRPYVLYNTWYDVRSPEYTDRAYDVMNRKNLRRIIDDFRDVMDSHPGFQLDTFVLDDGWDVYASDWDLRDEEFPGGLEPVGEDLESIDADLGIWFGPTGGYSFRQRRIDWMAGSGYEVVGDQLCLAGERYHELLKSRTVEMVRDSGAAYFKWDGIQFSCSEEDHGHPVGIYSRRAVLDALVDLSDAVRREDPDIFLNITSGTWLSPWWLRYANTIWMQGRDYGYSDVPSISRRDAAITYRDVVLYQDFGVHDFWFPIANLMTHGIIKGHLQKLGGEVEPLDKFTDNAVLYFARGVAMWELYVSPDLLSKGEWSAIVEGMAWARDRFDTLSSTEMIGGDPGGREAYGYVHFKDQSGVVAVRNPFIEPGTIDVALDPALGIAADASSLVLERVYPTRWIAPRLYAAGDVIQLPLVGYETAVYELYPVESAGRPVLAGVTFEAVREDGADSEWTVLATGEEVRLLNPELVRSIHYDGGEVAPDRLEVVSRPDEAPASDITVSETSSGIEVDLEIGSWVERATLALLYEPPSRVDEKEHPVVRTWLDGASVPAGVEQQEGRWSWHLIEVAPGSHTARIKLESSRPDTPVRGSVSIWLVASHRPDGKSIRFEPRVEFDAARPMPPRPWPSGELRSMQKLGEIRLTPR